MADEGGVMEICPKCHKMTAERNHYNQKLICYNRECLYQEQPINPDNEDEPPNPDHWLGRFYRR